MDGGEGEVRQAAHSLEVATRGQGLYECTPAIVGWVRRQGMQTGLLTVFCRHTSASLLIQENADPTVRVDLEAFFGGGELEEAAAVERHGGPL